jgi:hypothetical protein
VAAQMIRSADSMPSAEENIVVAPKRAGLALFVDPPMVLVATDRCRRARLPVRLGRRCVVRALSKPVIFPSRCGGAAIAPIAITPTRARN